MELYSQISLDYAKVYGVEAPTKSVINFDYYIKYLTTQLHIKYNTIKIWTTSHLYPQIIK